MRARLFQIPMRTAWSGRVCLVSTARGRALVGSALIVLAAAAAASEAYLRQALRDGEACAQGTGIVDVDILVCQRALRGGGFEGISRATLHTSLGRAYRARGRPDKALSEHQRAAELNPVSAVALHERGLDHLALGDLALAREDLTAAIALFPAFAEAWKDRGRIAFLTGEAPAALRDLSRAATILPEGAEIVAFRGLAHFQLGEHGAAEADFARALELGLDYPLAPVWQALSALHAGDADAPARARSILEDSLARLFPGEWPEALFRTLLGQQTSRDLLDAVAGMGAHRAPRRAYESRFYLALWSRGSGDGDGLRGLRMVRESAPARAVEAVLARSILAGDD